VNQLLRVITIDFVSQQPDEGVQRIASDFTS
jgi:hypothetical protein